MKYIASILFSMSLALVSCERTEWHHKDERPFADLRAGMGRIDEYVHQHGYPPETWSEVEGNEEVKSSPNRLAYMLVSTNGERVPLVYAPSKDGSRVLMAAYIDRKRVQGYMSLEAFRAMETSGELQTNSILERKERLGAQRQAVAENPVTGPPAEGWGSEDQ